MMNRSCFPFARCRDEVHEGESESLAAAHPCASEGQMLQTSDRIGFHGESGPESMENGTLQSSEENHQLRRVAVNLGTCVPLGRKFIVIREGKRTLMLKLRGGSHSGYSIESAVVKTRSTRSDKKHFLPKIVNGFGGMNDQKSKGDHVAVTKSNSGSGTSQRPKNFAKKSTGNNIRRTLHQAKSTTDKPTHQLLRKESLSSERRSRSRSPASESQKHLSQKHPEVSKISQGLTKEKDASRSRVDASLKEKNGRDGKPLETAHSKDTSKGLTRQTDEPRSRGDAPTKGQDRRDGKPPEIAQSKEKFESSKILENVPSITLHKDKQRRVDHANEKLGTTQSSAKVFKNEKDHMDKVSKSEGHPTKKMENKKPSSNSGTTLSSHGEKGRKLGECSKEMQATKGPDSATADEMPKTIKAKHDLKPNENTNGKTGHQPSTSNNQRQRSSTPTPVSPVKKSLLNKLSRKRHRSASPKVMLPTDDSKQENVEAMHNAKAGKDSIRLDTTKFGKVSKIVSKKLMMNAINQRKDNKVQTGSPETQVADPDKQSLTTVELEGEDKENEDGNQLQTKQASDIQSPDHLAPSPKRPRLSATKGGHQGHMQNGSRSSDSEDGLTKLMKDFQSAMSSSPRQESKKPSSKENQESKKPSSKENQESKKPSSKENAVRSFKCSPKKTVDSSTNPPILSPDRLSDLDALQTEAVSSDEDFECSQEAKDKKGKNGLTPEKGPTHLKDTTNADTSYEEDKEKKRGVSIDNFLLVDEVGYTPVKSPHPSPSRSGVLSDAITSTRDLGNFSPNIKSADMKGVKMQNGCVWKEADKEGLKTEFQKEYMLTKKFVDEFDESKELPAGSKELSGHLKQQGKGIRRGLKRTYEDLENHLDDKGTKKTHAIYTSTLVQTDLLVVNKKEQSCQTQAPKPDVRHQSIQFDGQLPEIDPEEVTPIVSAMLESECEERERLKKSLEDSMKKEEKWRGMVNDLCRQLRELRQRLEKKEAKPMTKDMHTKTDAEMSALPCIVSTQATQTEYGKDIGTLRSVSCQRSKTENPSNTTKPDHVIVVDDKTSPEPSKGSSPPQTGSLKTTKVVQVPVPEKATTPAAVPSLSLAKSQNATIPQKNTEEVIDLTGSEDPTSQVSKQFQKTAAPKKSPVGAVPNLNVHPAKTHAMKVVSPNAQLNLMRSAQMKQQQQHISSLNTLPPEKAQQSLPSTAQGVPRSAPNKLSQNAAAPITSINRIPAQAINQVLVSQPNATVPPPPLQPAPNVTGAVYQAAPTQLPVLRQIGNFNMIVQNQAQPRQDVLLTQQVIQPQVFTAQQQQVQNTVLLEELRRGIISTNQGKPNILIPRTTPQTMPIRVQQPPPQAKTQHQPKGNKQTQIIRLENQRVQQPQHPSPVASLQGQRFPLQSATYTSTAPPVSKVTHPQQSRNIVQHKEVPNVALQPNNGLRLVNGTWFPNTVQKLPQAPKPKQPAPASTAVRSPPPKHPAALPILQSFPSAGQGTTILPPPSIRISRSAEGVVLSWNISVSQEHPTVKKYFLYAYQVLNTPPSTSHWKRIGEVGALPPPMACTLNQFQPGSTYFLAICAVDVYERPGEFSRTEKVIIPTS